MHQPRTPLCVFHVRYENQSIILRILSFGTCACSMPDTSSEESWITKRERETSKPTRNNSQLLFVTIEASALFLLCASSPMSRASCIILFNGMPPSCRIAFTSVTKQPTAVAFFVSHLSQMRRHAVAPPLDVLNVVIVSKLLAQVCRSRDGRVAKRRVAHQIHGKRARDCAGHRTAADRHP